MQALQNFNPDVKWAQGAGCLVCGTNYSELGKEAGIQGVSLDVADEFIGHFGLCYDHARECGRLAGMFFREQYDELLGAVQERLDEAIAYEAAAKEAASQAKLDKDTVVRLLGVEPSAT